MILLSSVNWVLAQFKLRLGDPYVYGGTYSPTIVSQGCDCSGLVGWVLEALTNGPNNMSWAHVVSTESWPYDYSKNTPAAPGTIGPYNTVCVGSLADIPADAALTIDIYHDGGGVSSHMNCILNNTILESNGDSGTCTNGTGGMAADNSYWTDHWYLPGPVVNQEDIVTLFYPDVSNNNWSSDADMTNFLSQLAGESFSAVVHKVSQGSTYADPYWQTCQSWCAANNLLCLGYHYVSTDDPAAQAAQWNANNGGANAMLDFEANSGDIDNFWNVVNAFNAAGVNIAMAYIPNWYWQQIGSPDLSALPTSQIALVSSSYPDGGGYASDIYTNSGGDTGPGWAIYGGASPTAWQFTDSANVGGYTVDCNAYLGTADQLAQLFGVTPSTPPTPPPVPPTPPVPSNPPAIVKPADTATQVSQLWDQDLIRWDMLGGRTPIEAIAAIGQALNISGFKAPANGD